MDHIQLIIVKVIIQAVAVSQWLEQEISLKRFPSMAYFDPPLFHNFEWDWKTKHSLGDHDYYIQTE